MVCNCPVSDYRYIEPNIAEVMCMNGRDYIYNVLVNGEPLVPFNDTNNWFSHIGYDFETGFNENALQIEREINVKSYYNFMTNEGQFVFPLNNVSQWFIFDALRYTGIQLLPDYNIFVTFRTPTGIDEYNIYCPKTRSFLFKQNKIEKPMMEYLKKKYPQIPLE